jgi:hypothetical protein
VWVRNGDGLDATALLKSRYGFIAKVAHAVPENVALLRLHEQWSLPNGEGRLRADTSQARFMLSYDVTEPICAHFRQRCPLLSMMANILARIFANGTRAWQFFACRELYAACDTNPGIHLLSPSHSLFLFCYSIIVQALYNIFHRGLSISE